MTLIKKLLIEAKGDESMVRPIQNASFGLRPSVDDNLLHAKWLRAIANAKLGSLETEKVLSKYITNHKETLDELDKVRLAANWPHAALITGPTGTGKEIIAEAFHGPRDCMVNTTPSGRFIAVNCGAFNEQIIESELFGHVTGAFTGATNSRVGKLKMANLGTLFLDEIADLPMPIQVKLLRVMETGRFYALGSDSLQEVAVRIVAASSKSIWKMVQAGTFREDLYYRLAVVEIKTYPLKDRISDINLIAEAFGSNDDYSSLELRGNVRELRNIIARKQIYG